MKTITSILLSASILWSQTAWAAPHICDTGQVFADKAQCDAFCGGESGGALSCRELEANISGNPCDMSSYRGFVYSDGKTFALTNAAVAWGSEKTAIIRNSVDNAVVSRMLSGFGVSEAWIGAEDKSRSTAYNNIDESRFAWRDGSAIKYSNWKAGEPDNAFDASSIGVSPSYGEHWAVIGADGFWKDVGYNADGSERLFPAVVEFNGRLACVSGTEKQTDGISGLSGMVCAGKENADGISQITQCKPGIVFDTSDTAYLCQEEKTACIKSEKLIKEGSEGTFHICTDHLLFGRLVRNGNEIRVEFRGGNALGINPFENCPVDLTAAANDGWFIAETFTVPENVSDIKLNYSIPSGGGCLAGSGEATLTGGSLSNTISCPGDQGQFPQITYSYEYEIKKTDYACPYSGRPCIEDGGSYSCSPNDCLDASDSFVSGDETPEGTLDADNNGPRDDDGNCLGKLVIFPGQDKRCRRNGIQTNGKNCCRIADIEESQKPDITLSREETAAILWATGMPWLNLFAQVAEFNVCSGAEKQMWVNRGQDQCVYIGTYCSNTFAGGPCVQNKETYCCFDSDFARAFNEAGMEMLGKSWGTAKAPQCGGFSPEELQELSAMNISDHPKMREYADKLGEEFSGKLLNEFNKNFQTPQLEQSIKNQIEGAEK